jgi:hypothetical protein
VARRIAIVALLMLLVLPTLWSLVTGQRAVLVADAADQNAPAIAVVAPHSGVPEVGETVAIRTASANAVAVGQVADVTDESIAVQDAIRPDGWNASLTDLSGSVLAVFQGPVITFLTGLPPFSMSAAIILLIIALVAIPLRRTEPAESETAGGLPSARHIKHFTDVERA